MKKRQMNFTSREGIYKGQRRGTEPHKKDETHIKQNEKYIDKIECGIQQRHVGLKKSHREVYFKG